MEPQLNTQWIHEPWYVRTPQSIIDDQIDKLRVWTPQESDKLKEFI